LGRHIKNGEVLIKQGIIPKTNYYSYTEADYPFLNHHWGTGLIFYLIYSFTGFNGVSVFYSLVTLLTVLIFFDIARRKSSFESAFLISLFMLPLWASRVEIRPEAISYLFCGVFWWILENTKEKRINPNWVWILIPLMLLWVNLHIYFFLGLLFIGIYFVLGEKARFDREARRGERGKLGIVLFSSIFASLINPAGIRGFLYPLKIFGNYGYRLLENQGVLFLDRILKYPPNLYFKIAFVFLCASWVFKLLTGLGSVGRRKRIMNMIGEGGFLINLFLSIFISVISWKAVRNLALFGFIGVPIAAGNFREIRNFRGIRDVAQEARLFLVSSISVLIVVVLFLLNSKYWVERNDFGFGLKANTQKATEFYINNNLKGPIFNNYDNGGYLIFNLFPNEKVFVDNRPEAYSAKFFTDIYVPMQEQNDKWEQTDKKYGFNAIFFYRNDLTPWSQTFLINRIKDKSWAPIFVDEYSIIFLKRNQINSELIKKFELPKEMFIVR